jgi:hypothetical protein
MLLLSTGLVESWAAGASWQEVMADTSLDDGDMARLLARTADMLKQVGRKNNNFPVPPPPNGGCSCVAWCFLLLFLSRWRVVVTASAQAESLSNC